jgi:hypothetical protein
MWVADAHAAGIDSLPVIVAALAAVICPPLGARPVAEDFPLGDREQLAHGADMQREDFTAYCGVMAGEPEREQFGQRRPLDGWLMPGQ